MVDIAKQIIDFYLKNKKAPKLDDLEFSEENRGFLLKKGAEFVTLYLNGEVIGSAGNIEKIEESLIHELIKNVIEALVDKRFSNKITDSDAKDIKIRIDLFKNRTVLNKGEFKNLDPVKFGIITIDKDYSKLAVILPNISPTLLVGEDFIPILEEKLLEKFDEDKYIIYSIETDVFRNF